MQLHEILVNIYIRSHVETPYSLYIYKAIQNLLSLKVEVYIRCIVPVGNHQ